MHKKDESNLKILEKILIFISFFVYLIALPPFLKYLVISGHDIGAHLTYIRLFTDALYQGQIPVRWIEWSSPGLNQPLFSYYPSLFYYLAQVPHAFRLDLLASSNITLLFLWVFSGFFIYLLIKNLTKDKLAALVGSLIYVFSPYHILDVFVRSAYPELTALFFAPGMFWSLERLIETAEKKYIGFFALILAGVYLAHPPSLIIFSFPLFLFISYLIWNKYKENGKIELIYKKLFYSVLAILLGLGLSAFFLIPQVFQQNLISYQHLSSGYSDFHKHFVCLVQLFWSKWGFGISVPGCLDDLSFQIGIVNWIVIITTILILIFIFVKKLKHKSTSLTKIFLLIVFFGAYMSLSYSLPFWDGIPYMSIIQFPWRFLSVVIFAVAILTGLIFTYIKAIKVKLLLFALLALLLPISVYSFIYSSNYLPKDYFNQDSVDFYKIQSSSIPETAFMPIYAKVLPESQSVDSSEILDPLAKIKVIKNEFIYKEYLLSSSKKSTVLLYIHYFPGWKFYVNREGVKVNFSNIYGYPEFSLKPGENLVIAKLENTNLITLSNLISLVSIFTVVAIILNFYRSSLVKRFKSI